MVSSGVDESAKGNGFEQVIGALTNLSIAALGAGVHAIRMMANAGLVSPSDVDESFDGITEAIENMPEPFSSNLAAAFFEAFAEIKDSASTNWNK
ncbi:hypothetical protein [Novosphingobium humi]|uniref:Phage tail tube protein, GTA-gp10 n=1 Tax=Novosphingobium humi TaxID=2282397 RepID=A0ABY7TTC2_9SPHN|nr:hypothetical protein [Novosphingobium humi]WCT76474.1 hypothetical protein PQ457_11025 [Novosphingobium humi]